MEKRQTMTEKRTRASKKDSGDGNPLSGMLNRASNFYQSKQFEAARKIYCDILSVTPNHPDLLHMVGLIDNELGDFSSAEHYLKEAIQADPKNLNFIINIGQFYLDNNKADRALSVLLKSLSANPADPRTLMLIGDIYLNKMEYDEAIKYYQKSIHLNPESNSAYNKMGNCFLLKNSPDRAVKCYKKSLSINVKDVAANHNLGNIYKRFGMVNEAVKYYKAALSENPENAKVLLNLGTMHLKQRNFQQASEVLYDALALDPDNYLINYYIGLYLKESGRSRESIEWFETSLKKNSKYYPAFVSSLLTLPIIYTNQAEIELFREKFKRGLDRLLGDYDPKDQRSLNKHSKSIASWTNFYLPYQGKDDLSLCKKYGEYFHSVMTRAYPDLHTRRSLSDRRTRQKTRIGYVSEYMYGHTVGKLFIGWVENIDSSRFDVYCYHTNEFSDSMTQRFKDASHRYCHITKPFDRIAAQIISDRIDVLVFFDIGMNTKTQLLAALRMAPVQCVTWGHPLTTGLPSIDYFLSSELMEPPNGQQYYTEKLHILPHLSISYKPPSLPKKSKRRSYFGLGDGDFVYLSTQSLFKYLPEDDFMFAKIAAMVPNSKFVFIAHESEHVTGIFKQRLKQEFGKYQLDSDAYCIFQPRLSHEDFLSLNMVSDVLLDPPAWSGGMTSLEGVSCGGVPVTLPGKFMRSRHTYAILKHMGIEETIAADKDDYISIAARLGNDKTFFSDCKTAVKSNLHRIYEDEAAICALEAFYDGLFD